MLKLFTLQIKRDIPIRQWLLHYHTITSQSVACEATVNTSATSCLRELQAKTKACIDLL